MCSSDLQVAEAVGKPVTQVAEAAGKPVTQGPETVAKPHQEPKHTNPLPDFRKSNRHQAEAEQCPICPQNQRDKTQTFSIFILSVLHRPAPVTFFRSVPRVSFWAPPEA